MPRINQAMDAIEKLLTVINAYQAVHKVSDARVSTLVFNDGSRILQLKNGRDIGTKRWDRAIQWFSDNWPDNAVWPAEVTRPKATVEVAA